MDDIIEDLFSKNFKNSNSKGNCLQNNSGQNTQYWRYLYFKSTKKR